MFRNPVVDLAVILVVALLIFGPKRLPQLGKGLGHGFREFKDGLTGKSTADEAEERPALNSAAATPQPPAAVAERPASEAGPTEPSA
jgi:sec-independent protein translocase protein TatA